MLAVFYLLPVPEISRPQDFTFQRLRLNYSHN